MTSGSRLGTMVGCLAELPSTHPVQPGSGSGSRPCTLFQSSWQQTRERTWAACAHCYRLTGEVEPCFSLQMGTPACCRSSKPRSVWSAASACGPDRAGLLRGRDVAMQERVQPARCSHLPQSVPSEHLHEESQCVTRDIPRLLFQVTALLLVSMQ